MERAKEGRENKYDCLFKVQHRIVVIVSLFFSLAQDNCFITRLFLIG